MAILLTGLIGLVFVYLGFITLNGSYKKWYLGPRIFPPQAMVYATIPVGIGFMELCIILMVTPILGFEIAQKMITLLVGPTFVIGFVLALWRPKWIKPKWVQWLEENYGSNIYTLIADARKNPEAWANRVSTQQGLEEWAAEVVGKPSPKRKF